MTVHAGHLMVAIGCLVVAIAGWAWALRMVGFWKRRYDDAVKDLATAIRQNERLDRAAGECAENLTDCSRRLQAEWAEHDRLCAVLERCVPYVPAEVLYDDEAKRTLQ